MASRHAAALLIAALLLASETARAQEGDHAGCAALVGIVSRELIERPLALTNGAGRMHQVVSTRSSKAQAYYDQGIAYLSSYVWVEAARSFHEALRLDTNLAMAHLGLAKVFENTDAVDDARAQLDKAEGLAANPNAVTEKEASWIRLGREQLDAIYAPESEQPERLKNYRAAIDVLIALDPSDPHAWVLRGNAEEPGAWGRGQAGGVASIAFYEAALRRDPKHLGAHHFLAHSYENIGQHATAAEYARLYAAEASGVAHAQHMLGHVLPRLGKWREARDQFVKANAIEEAYYRREKVAPEEDWHHGHNLDLLGAVYLRLGDDKNAESTLRGAFELKERGPVAGTYGGPYVQYLLLRGRNEEALTAAQEIEARPTDIARLIGTALGGEALLGLGRTDEARQQLARADELKTQVEKRLANTRYSRYLPVVTVQYVEILRGRILLRGNRPQEGDEILLAMADEVGRNPRLDAWSSGMLRVDRAVADADRLGRPDLAAQLREKTKGLR